MKESANENEHGPLDGETPKYRVEKWDGSPMDPNARYLVLRVDGIDHEAERVALSAYLQALTREGRTNLVGHLRGFFGL